MLTSTPSGNVIGAFPIRDILLLFFSY